MVPFSNAAAPKPPSKGSAKPVLFKTRAAWRTWLEKNHAKKTEIWLAYYKKGTGKNSVAYKEALDEALCFGWIDSVINRIDDERYMQRWTPRHPRSIWSAANKSHIRRLIAEGRMAAPGLAAIAIAKRNGSWNKLNEIERIERGGGLPKEALAAIEAVSGLMAKFDSLTPSRRKMLAYWIASAKRPETVARRLSQLEGYVDTGTLPGFPALGPMKKPRPSGSR
jgi:uncharacterized protein YdeI (YjbR/CyaY-like superfamily)